MRVVGQEGQGAELACDGGCGATHFEVFAVFADLFAKSNRDRNGNNRSGSVIGVAKRVESCDSCMVLRGEDINERSESCCAGMNELSEPGDNWWCEC